MFIISPLISLMDEQKEKLLSINIPCAALHGNNSNKEEEIQRILNDEIKIIYMSPEYLIRGDGLHLAKTLIDANKLGFLALELADRAACLVTCVQCTQVPKFRVNPGVDVGIVLALGEDLELQLTNLLPQLRLVRVPTRDRMRDCFKPKVPTAQEP